MESYEVSAAIDAPPEQVWDVLMAGDYTAWDSGMARFQGRIAEGQKVKVWSELMPERAFPVKVSLDHADRTMTWTGGMPIPGLFRGVRTFRVRPDGDGAVFTMREEFTGLLLGPIFRSMPELQPTFDQFAAGLTSRAESEAAAHPESPSTTED